MSATPGTVNSLEDVSPALPMCAHQNFRGYLATSLADPREHTWAQLHTLLKQTGCAGDGMVHFERFAEKLVDPDENECGVCLEKLECIKLANTHSASGKLEECPYCRKELGDPTAATGLGHRWGKPTRVQTLQTY